MCNNCIDTINKEILILVLEYKEHQNLLDLRELLHKISTLHEIMQIVQMSDMVMDTNYITKVNMDLLDCVVQTLDTVNFDYSDINSDINSISLTQDQLNKFL